MRTVRSIFRVTFLSWGVAALAACSSAAPGADRGDEELSDTVSAATIATAETRDDGRATISVRAGDMTVWMTAVAATYGAGDTLRVVMKGRASREIVNAMSWIPDDGFGNAVVTGKQTFEVELTSGYEVNSILSGLPLFVHLDTKTGAKQYDVALHLAPTFTRFDGDGRVYVSKEIAPVYAGARTDANDPLRYRGLVRAIEATNVSVALPGGPTAQATPTGASAFAFDMTYADLATAVGNPRTPVAITAQLGTARATKRAGIDLRLARVGLTSAGGDVAWPPPACARATFQCVRAAEANASNYASCGSYRDVARCVHADACEVLGGTQPLTLAPGPNASWLDASRVAFNTASSNSGSWRSVDTVRAYRHPSCVAAPPTLEQVTTLALAEEAILTQRTYPDVGSFATLDHAGLESHFFAGPTGKALLDSLDALGGSTAVEAKLVMEDVPCHNCTDRVVTIVLYYRATNTVVAIDGKYGFDS